MNRSGYKSTKFSKCFNVFLALVLMAGLFPVHAHAQEDIDLSENITNAQDESQLQDSTELQDETTLPEDALDATLEADNATYSADEPQTQSAGVLESASLDAGAIDLADPNQWSHMSAYSLVAGGSYYLSDDVVVTDTGGILFYAAGEATLDLRGHTLSFGEDGLTNGASTTGFLIGGSSGDTVSLNIISSTEGIPGSICFYNTDYSLTLYETAQVSVDNVNITKKMTTNPSVRTYVTGSGSSAVNIANKSIGTSNLTSQAFRASNCTISADLSQFARPTTTGAVSAIYVSSDTLSSVSLDNVTVECAAPENLTTSDGGYLDAYGIYCAKADCQDVGTKFVIQNSNLKATSLNGSAFGFCDLTDTLPAGHLGATWLLQGQKNSIELLEASTGEGWAIKSLCADQGVIQLDSQLTISAIVASSGAPMVSSNCIWIGGELGLTLMEGFACDEKISVLAGTDSFSANYDDLLFASNQTGKSDSALAEKFTNALYDAHSNTCSISAHSGYLGFAAEEADAVAQVVDGQGISSFYGTFYAAMKNLQADGTLKVLTDMPNLDVVTGEDLAGTVDLCGHTLGSLVSSSSQKLVITSTQDGAKLQHQVALTTTYIGVVANMGIGTLELDNISIEVSSLASSGRFCAIYVGGSGRLALKNCSVTAEGHSWTAGLVNTKSAPVSLQETEITVSSEGSNSIGLFATSSLMLTVNNCHISAYAAGSTGKADGVRISGNVKSYTDVVNITSSSLSAQSEGLWSYGLYISGSKQNLTLEEDEIKATLSGNEQTAKCIGFSFNSASGSCNIQGSDFAADASDSTVNSSDVCWSMAVSGVNAQVSLSGNVSLSSSNSKHIKYSCPITVADSTAIVTNNSDESIGVYATAQTSADALFYCGSNMASQLKVRVSELEGGYYENITQSSGGWQLSYSTAKQALVWSADPVATVSGKKYPTLQDAVNAANSGDTVEVISDVMSTHVLAISKELTIDLQGHQVELRSESQNGALVVTAAAGQEVQIIDSLGRSENTGSITLLVGAESESEDELDCRSSDQGTFYSGISMKGAANLTVQDVDITVAYVGNAQGYAVGVQGIYQGKEAGQLKLADVHLNVGTGNLPDIQETDPSLEWEVRNQDVARMFGIYSDATKGFLDIDASSEVTVVNSGSPLLRGVNVNRILSGNTNVSYSAALVNSGTVKEVTLDEQSDLYNQVCELFLYEAKYDSDASVYYACPLELSDGTLVWAISDVVPVSEVGSKTAIVPAHFYMQSSYVISPDAKGIVLGDFAGEVDIAGSVNVMSDQGDAIALDATQNKNASVWNITGAQLSASTNAASDIDVCTGKEPDAGVQLGLDKSWWINSLASVDEVVQCTPLSCLFAGCEGAQNQLVLSGETTLIASGKHSVAFVVDESTIQISNDWTLGTDSDNRFAVEGTWRGNVPGTNFATGSVSDSMTTLFYDDAGQVALVFDEGTLHWDGVCTVEFVDETGTVLQSVQGVGKGQSVALPDHSLVERAANETYSYEFLGWALDASAAEPDVLASQTVMRFEPAAGATKVTYYPLYRTNPIRISVTFTGMHDQAAITYQVDTGASLQKAISSQDMTASIPVLVSYEQDDITYVPVGWQLSCQGESAQFTPAAVADYKAYGDVSCAAVYKAVSSEQSLVEFVVDGVVYASALNVGENPSWTEISAQSSMPGRSSYGMTCSFAGWQDAVDTYGPTDELPAVQQAGKRLTYTALFNETPSLYNIDFAGVYFKTESGNYARESSRVKVYCPYGTDPEETLMNGHGAQRSFTQDGYVYTLAGWSTRADDKEPLYASGELPKVTPDKTGSLGLVYYAYYDVVPATTNVVFQIGDTVYATAQNMNFSSTIAEAFAATESSNPQVEGYEFLGWVASPDATVALTSISQVQNYVDAETNRVTLWALFRQSESTPESETQPDSGSDTPASGESSTNQSDSTDQSATDNTNTTSNPTAATIVKTNVTSSAKTSSGSVVSETTTSDVTESSGEDNTLVETGTTNVAGSYEGDVTTGDSQTSQVDQAAGQGNVLATLFAIMALLLLLLFIWWRIRRKNKQFDADIAEAPADSDDDWNQITFDEEDFS